MAGLGLEVECFVNLLGERHPSIVGFFKMTSNTYMPRSPIKPKSGRPRKARTREQSQTQQVEEEVYKWSNDPKEPE